MRKRSRTGQPTDAIVSSTGGESIDGARTTEVSCGRGARPQPRDRASEQEPARHVARVVDAEGDAGRGDRGVQARERGPTEGADPELSCGHAGERREHRRMAGGPRRPVRLGDHPAGALRIREEGPRTIDDPLRPLKEQPGGARAREGAGALAAAAGQRERAGRRRRRVERPELGDPREEAVDRLAVLGVESLEEVLVELPAVLGPERGVPDRRSPRGERRRPRDLAQSSGQAHRPTIMRQSPQGRQDGRARRATPCDASQTIRTTRSRKGSRPSSTGGRAPDSSPSRSAPPLCCS